MIVIPAIDLMEGRAVRLLQGERDRVTTYADDPEALVERFVSAGARRIHLVDLDGAFAGSPVQQELVGRLARRARGLGAQVQTGGGIRDASAVRVLLEHGADFVVVGTLAVRAPDVVARLCADHPGRIIVAADARDGKIAVDGWQSTSETTSEALAIAAQRWGAAAILHTDVARDGMQTGPAIEATAALQRKVEIPVFASGGVARLTDLQACAAAGLQGVVLGKALYEGAFTMEEALGVC